MLRSRRIIWLALAALWLAAGGSARAWHTAEEGKVTPPVYRVPSPVAAPSPPAFPAFPAPAGRAADNSQGHSAAPSGTGSAATPAASPTASAPRRRLPASHEPV